MVKKGGGGEGGAGLRLAIANEKESPRLGGLHLSHRQDITAGKQMVYFAATCLPISGFLANRRRGRYEGRSSVSGAGLE